jgi:hypothetical protein
MEICLEYEDKIKHLQYCRFLAEYFAPNDNGLYLHLKVFTVKKNEENKGGKERRDEIALLFFCICDFLFLFLFFFFFCFCFLFFCNFYNFPFFPLSSFFSFLPFSSPLLFPSLHSNVCKNLITQPTMWALEFLECLEELFVVFLFIYIYFYYLFYYLFYCLFYYLFYYLLYYLFLFIFIIYFYLFLFIFIYFYYLFIIYF